MNAIKTAALAIMLATTLAAMAQPRHFVHMPRHSGRAPHITTIVTHRTAAGKRVVNKLNKDDRLNMALAYLSANPSLTKDNYSKMTGLSKAIAEAELDAFAANRHTGIVVVANGKKKTYTLRRTIG